MVITREEAERALRSTFGVPGFRAGQWEATSAALSGRDACVFLPTGAGKSMCYIVPALLSQGVVVVISPLLSLIEDQIASLQAAGVPARSISSAQSMAENNATRKLMSMSPPALQLLFLSPETASNTRMLKELLALEQRGFLTLLAVDEAHCVSQWGHDFRTAYLKLGTTVRAVLRSTPLMALSATATNEVRADLATQLHLREPLQVSTTFDRAEIFYECVLKDVLPGGSPYAHLLERLQKRHAGQCGIIFVGTREGTMQLAHSLVSDGLAAAAYHAGLSNTERASSQRKWMEGKVLVMVATVAFGMGIDKRDVRFVIHWSLPQSFEAFYQESGRAARDGKPATSTLYYSEEDAGLARFLLCKTAAPERLDGRIAAFERLVAHCVAGAGCRRASLLRYFGEARLPLLGGAICCDLCSSPSAAADAAARLSLHNQTAAAAAAGSSTADDGSAPARKKTKRDKHNTGLVASSSESDGDEAPFVRRPERSTFVPAARLPKGQKRKSSGEVSLQLSKLAAEEKDDEEESGASKLRRALLH